eukprot:CAMPEP_0173081060 /NCGR_PEP_ID=MMETSP1102-20130122/16842_1 /TAXON_ID=49646 /ORGANISM="Geminigera sp., Strain Caron Lab Isolate" /LENGTH=198 /DNA_ID=CAMNT_0013955157 /DNA_START=147 /DNA_END=743 /DNA_ORIENTATION=+
MRPFGGGDEWPSRAFGGFDVGDDLMGRLDALSLAGEPQIAAHSQALAHELRRRSPVMIGSRARSPVNVNLVHIPAFPQSPQPTSVPFSFSPQLFAAAEWVSPQGLGLLAPGPLSPQLLSLSPQILPVQFNVANHTPFAVSAFASDPYKAYTANAFAASNANAFAASVYAMPAQDPYYSNNQAINQAVSLNQSVQGMMR